MTLRKRVLMVLMSWWVFIVRERLGYRRPPQSMPPVLTEHDHLLRQETELKFRQAQAMELYLTARKDVLWTKGRPYV